MGPDGARQLCLRLQLKKRAFMSNQTKTDNTYAEGTIVTAKANPALYQRIYYCAVVGDEARKLLVYFDRELMFPNSSKTNVSNQ